MGFSFLSSEIQINPKNTFTVLMTFLIAFCKVKQLYLNLNCFCWIALLSLGYFLLLWFSYT